MFSEIQWFEGEAKQIQTTHMNIILRVRLIEHWCSLKQPKP